MLTRLRVLRERDDCGLSLVELLVSMLLATLMFALVVPLVTTVFASDKKLSAHVAVVGDLQRAMDRISRDARAADPITAATATSVTLQIRRGGACSLITYAVTTAGASSVTASGYASTGMSLTAVSAACATPGTTTSTAILIRAVPSTLTPFSFANKDGVGLTPPFSGPNDLQGIYRMTVTLQGTDSSNHVQTLSTDVDVRNASA